MMNNDYDYWQEEKEINNVASDCWANIREIKKALIPAKENEELNAKGIEQIDLLESNIDNLKDRCNSLNDDLAETVDELGELKYELEQGNASYIIGNYDELKRRMQIEGIWKDEMDYFFENLVRYSNKI